MASFNLVSRKGAEVLECAALAWYWVRATDLLRLNTLLPLPHHLPPRTEFHFHIKPEDDTIPPKMTIVLTVGASLLLLYVIDRSTFSIAHLLMYLAQCCHAGGCMSTAANQNNPSKLAWGLAWLISLPLFLCEIWLFW